MNNIPRQKAICELIRVHSPNLVFLQETKLCVDSMLNFVPKIYGRGLCQCVRALGSSGGLSCLWDLHKVIPLWWLFERCFISLVASSLETGERIILSNVYSPMDLLGKVHLWS